VQVEADLKKVANICWLEDAPRLHGCVATLETPATSALASSDVVSTHFNVLFPCMRTACFALMLPYSTTCCSAVAALTACTVLLCYYHCLLLPLLLAITALQQVLTYTTAAATPILCIHRQQRWKLLQQTQMLYK
jgi:hypothetical protein